MPFKSQAQSRLMHAVKNNPALASKTGVPVKVAKKFVSEGHGQKVGKLPQHKGPFTLKREKRREEKEPMRMHRREGAAGERAEGEAA